MFCKTILVLFEIPNSHGISLQNKAGNVLTICASCSPSVFLLQQKQPVQMSLKIAEACSSAVVSTGISMKDDVLIHDVYVGFSELM